MARLSFRAPHWLAATASLALALTIASVTSAQSTLARIEPGAVGPAATTELTLRGTKLIAPLQVWSSFPANWEVLADEENQSAEDAKNGRETVRVKATLDGSVGPGIGGVAVATAEGPTQVLLVPVDDLPSVRDAGGNHALATAQQVALPIAVDGVSDGTAFDYFKFAGKAGQTVSLEVLGARLASDFDPVVRLLDEAGWQLATADDDAALGADCRLRHTLPADGTYLVELHDNRYKAGGRYRLRIADLSLTPTTFPLLPLQGHAEADSQQRPTVVEAIVPEKPDEPTAVAALPCAIRGTLETAGDRDEFRFTLKKDQRVRFEPLTRTLGSPALLRMWLLGADGKQLAETPINEDDQPPLSFVAPSDGEYRLIVEELVDFGGPDYTYGIEASTGPTFGLQLKNVPKQPAKLAFAAAAGSAIDLTVECQRHGYDGPIALSVDSPRAGWQAFNATIPAKGKETRMFLIAPADLQPGEFVPLRIVGKADVGGREHVAAMSFTAQLRAARPALIYPPLWLDGLLSVGGSESKPDFYKVTASKPEVFFPRLIGQTQLTLTFDRLDEKFKDQPLTVVPLQVPPGLAVAEIKRNGNGPQETYDIVLKGAKDLPEGKHALKYLAYAEYAGRGQAVVSGEIPVSIVTPLAVSLSPAGPLTQGEPQKLKITLARAGDDKQPVEVKFKKLPAGVSAPESIKLEADQNELEIELTAAADAPVGKFDDIAVTATTKYAGQDLSVDSPSAALEVKAP